METLIYIITGTAIVVIGNVVALCLCRAAAAGDRRINRER
jgi:hypothetical protein